MLEQDPAPQGPGAVLPAGTESAKVKLQIFIVWSCPWWLMTQNWGSFPLTLGSVFVVFQPCSIKWKAAKVHRAVAVGRRAARERFHMHRIIHHFGLQHVKSPQLPAFLVLFYLWDQMVSRLWTISLSFFNLNVQNFYFCWWRAFQVGP